MIHFSCDLCGCPIEGERFEVRVEILPAFHGDEITEAMLDQDHLQAIAEELNSPSRAPVAPGRKSYRYDVCDHCRSRVEYDPLARQRTSRVKFSEN